MQQEKDLLILKSILYSSALNTASWRRYTQTVIDAGIESVADLVETSDATLKRLHIPEAPLDRILELKSSLILLRDQHKNAFSQPLGNIPLISNYTFKPSFSLDYYLQDIVELSNKKDLLQKAADTVRRLGLNGLTFHQAVFIALYCDESAVDTSSFYNLMNRAACERTSEFPTFMPAIHLLNSAFSSLPKIEAVTWRGTNRAPDLEKFIVNRIVCFAGICSTSTDKNVTLQFMETKPRIGPHFKTLFRLNMHDGKNISQWSPYPNEKEVIANFCSRWRVTRIEHDYHENFDFGEYICDYYIELEQMEYEKLFNELAPASGLELLARFDISQTNKDYTDFRMRFLSIYDILNNGEAQLIFAKHLKDQWNPENRQFVPTSTDESIHDLIINLLMGIQSLNDELTENAVDVVRAFQICTDNHIYSALELLFTKSDDRFIERTTDDLQALGFSYVDADKLYMQEKRKQELPALYQRLDLKGTADEPLNIGPWLSRKRLIHYIVRDGAVISISRIVQFAIDGCQKNCCQRWTRPVWEYTYKHIWDQQLHMYTLERSDFYIVGFLFLVQLGVYSLQLWYGDITIRQFLKTFTVGSLSLCAGLAATAIGIMLGPVGWGGIIIGAVTGAIVGGGTEAILNKLLDYFFPDGETEEINAARKLYDNALAILNCMPNSTFVHVQRTYRRMALENHPDKNDNKEAAKEKFQKIVGAYEIVKNYHFVLKESSELLNIPVETLTIEIIKQWKKTHKDKMLEKKIQRAYNILYRHVVYTSTNSMRLRKFLDSDRSLKLDSTKNPSNNTIK